MDCRKPINASTPNVNIGVYSQATGCGANRPGLWSDNCTVIPRGDPITVIIPPFPDPPPGIGDCDDPLYDPGDIECVPLTEDDFTCLYNDITSLTLLEDGWSICVSTAIPCCASTGDEFGVGLPCVFPPYSSHALGTIGVGMIPPSRFWQHTGVLQEYGTINPLATYIELEDDPLDDVLYTDGLDIVNWGDVLIQYLSETTGAVLGSTTIRAPFLSTNFRGYADASLWALTMYGAIKDSTSGATVYLGGRGPVSLPDGGLDSTVGARVCFITAEGSPPLNFDSCTVSGGPDIEDHLFAGLIHSLDGESFVIFSTSGGIYYWTRYKKSGSTLIYQLGGTYTFSNVLSTSWPTDNSNPNLATVFAFAENNMEGWAGRGNAGFLFMVDTSNELKLICSDSFVQPICDEYNKASSAPGVYAFAGGCLVIKSTSLAKFTRDII